MHSESDQPTRPLAGHDDASGLEFGPGDRVGPYVVRQRLGAGGMGVVWLAEQEEPIRRRVALKIIKWGMDTRQVVARFAAERQVLARLDHPNVARVFDAGSTEKGRPYFVMEYVPGVPITEYCDTHRLSLRERIDLFLQVCEGVEHAHRNAIIHRDLKPQNVLVTSSESKPTPKIIDFGVAKATDHSLDTGTVFTEHGQIVGTPEYMSPEQAEMSSLDVDTRTDVYALGVLLYELLTGLLPLDRGTLRDVGVEAIRRRIREIDPPLPSTRLRTLGAEQVDAARSHATSPGRWASALRGDLDWITMKALEKDRTRRYGTATALADDLRRHLRDEPVSASPPSVVYRARKFVRRHGTGVGVAAFTLVMLVGFGVAMGIQADRVARERDRAEAEAAKAQQVSQFLVDLFERSDPAASKGEDVTAREILDAGAERIERELGDQAAIRATMLGVMGRVYSALSLYDDARPMLLEAVALAEETPELGPLALATALYDLSRTDAWIDRYDEALVAAERSLAIRERELGPDDPLVAESLNAIGNIQQRLDRLDDAATTHARALAIRERVLGPMAEETAASIHNLAIVHYFRDDLEAAARLFRRSADIEAAVRGRDNHDYATSLHTLAIVRSGQGRLQDAWDLQTEALEIRQRVLGAEHHHTALSVGSMGEILVKMGRVDEGREHFERALRIIEATAGAESGDAAWIREMMAEVESD